MSCDTYHDLPPSPPHPRPATSLLSSPVLFSLLTLFQTHWPVFFEHTRQISPLESLQWLFLLPGTLLSQICTWITPTPPSSLLRKYHLFSEAYMSLVFEAEIFPSLLCSFNLPCPSLVVFFLFHCCYQLLRYLFIMFVVHFLSLPTK